jgi:hypothetical protein
MSSSASTLASLTERSRRREYKQTTDIERLYQCEGCPVTGARRHKGDKKRLCPDCWRAKKAAADLLVWKQTSVGQSRHDRRGLCK